MTKVLGTLRSTDTQESEGSGDNISDARQAATAALNLDGFELQQANTVTSKATGETTIKTRARSTATKPHEAIGANYDAALQAYLTSVPKGWQSQNLREIRQ
ncbi:hypothetical protein [Curtobacterium flaccumfaciens]|uniref:hypothetical protein n=1 Tax=Curtobacterium flaccumfaciens TaxID=2035 RepID=UPI001BDF2274|nr:hypothetical protein [Curtobacterium flaccumfaciens]MBT1674537.1 hypothetical protein [Curtobacterium flaccumfaciens pv. flaccumfaciens]